MPLLVLAALMAVALFAWATLKMIAALARLILLAAALGLRALLGLLR